MSPNDIKITRQMKIIFLAPMFVGFVIAIVGLAVEGPEYNRLLPGGLCLILAAVGSMATYSNIRTGGRVGLVRNLTWDGKLTSGAKYTWIDKQDQPVRFWLATIMSVWCSVGMFVYAVVIFAFSMRALGDR